MSAEFDFITIDANQKKLELHLTESEIQARLAAWKQPTPKYTRGVLGKFARLVSCASEGAVTDEPKPN